MIISESQIHKTIIMLFACVGLMCFSVAFAQDTNSSDESEGEISLPMNEAFFNSAEGHAFCVGRNTQMYRLFYQRLKYVEAKDKYGSRVAFFLKLLLNDFDNDTNDAAQFLSVTPYVLSVAANYYCKKIVTENENFETFLAYYNKNKNKATRETDDLQVAANKLRAQSKKRVGFTISNYSKNLSEVEEGEHSSAKFASSCAFISKVFSILLLAESADNSEQSKYYDRLSQLWFERFVRENGFERSPEDYSSAVFGNYTPFLDPAALDQAKLCANIAKQNPSFGVGGADFEWIETDAIP